MWKIKQKNARDSLCFIGVSGNYFVQVMFEYYVSMVLFLVAGTTGGK